MTEATRASRPDRRSLAALAVLLLVIAAAWWRVGLLRETLYYFDITELNMPLRTYFGDSLRAGRLPLWTSRLYAGYPILAEGQAGPLYPPNLLLFPWMKPWVAFNLSTVAHVAGAALFMWIFLRRFAGRAGALVGSMAFVFSGFLVQHLMHTSMFNQTVWLPFLLWLVDHGIDRGDRRWFVAGAFVVAVQLTAGHQQTAIYSALTVAAYMAALALPYRRGLRHGARRIATSLVILYGLGTALAVIQAVPTLELLSQSMRSGGIRMSMAMFGSWMPLLYPTFFFPASFGSRMCSTHWLDAVTLNHEMTAYAGVVALALALYGGRYARGRRADFFLGLAAVSLLVALGRYSYFVQLLHAFPLLDSLRVPARASLLTSLAVAALAAQGVDVLCGNPPGRARALSLRPIGALWLLVALAVGILLFCYGGHLFGSAPTASADSLAARLGREVRTDMVLRLGLLAATTAAAALAIRRPQWRRLIAGAFVALAAVDGMSYAAGRNPTLPPSYWETPPRVVAELRQGLGHQRFEIVDPAPTGVAAHSATGWIRGNGFQLEGKEPLPSNLCLMYGVRRIEGNLPLRLERWKRLTWDAPGLKRQLLQPKLLVRREGDTFRVVRREEDVRRAWLVHRVHHQPPGRESQRRLVSLVRDPLREAMVEAPPETRLPVVVPTVEPERVVIERDDEESMTLRVRAAAPGLLVVADAYYPGWVAQVDGRPTPIYPTDILLRGVFVHAGEHTVTFRYRPVSFRVGVVGSLLALVVAGWLLRKPPGAEAEGTDLETGGSIRARRWIVWAFVFVVAVSALTKPGVWVKSFRRFHGKPVPAAEF